MVDLTLLLVGDVMLGRGVNQELAYRAPDYPWGDTLALFERADFRVANLECTISDRGAPWPEKEFTFRSDAKNIAVLTAARIDAVSLANNHSLDFGPDALADTLAILDRAGIAHAGAGTDLTAAFKPGCSTVRDTKIGLISFTDDRPLWEAGSGRPGIAYVPVDFREDRAEHLFDTIRSTRSVTDVLIVAAHWGPNWGYSPPPSQIPFAHRMVELGADVVFGHSGHVVRGVEIYRGRPIIYCAGNFIDDYGVDPDERNDQSFVFLYRTGRDGAARQLLLYPTVIADCQARMAAAHEAEQIAAKMARLCVNFGTTPVWNAREQCLEIASK